MNAPVLARPQAHHVTASEFRRMWEAGVFDQGLDLELIDGVIYDMAGDGWRTIDWNAAVNRWLVRSLEPPFVVVPDKTLELTDDLGLPKPDFWIHDRASSKGVTGADALLVIEIADTTLAHDRDVKAPIYGKAGVREYWLIDVERRAILVFRQQPGGGGFAEPKVITADTTIEALLIPGLRVRLNDLLAPSAS